MINSFLFFFFFNDTATTEIYTLSLHDALPIWQTRSGDHTRKETCPFDDRIRSEVVRVALGRTRPEDRRAANRKMLAGLSQTERRQLDILCGASFATVRNQSIPTNGDA